MLTGSSRSDPANNITNYNCDTENKLTSITGANNHTTYFVYASTPVQTDVPLIPPTLPGDGLMPEKP
jgi:YD repeat-containing protein